MKQSPQNTDSGPLGRSDVPLANDAWGSKSVVLTCLHAYYFNFFVFWIMIDLWTKSVRPGLAVSYSI